MIYDALIMTAVTEELSRVLLGGKIERITQPTPFDLIVKVYTTTGKHDLLISSEAEAARVHLTWIKRENPPRPSAFCMVLRKYLDGARIAGFERPSGFGERLLGIRCDTFDDRSFTLVAEIMGKHSNIILLNDAKEIVGTAKYVSSDINRYREILPGVTYRPPPRQRGKRNPLDPFTPTDDEPLSEDDAREWLVKTFSGVSPILAREAVFRAGLLAGDRPLTQQSLYDGLADALSVVQSHAYAPMVWSDDTGNTHGAYPIGLRSVPARNQYPRESMSIALDNASSSIGKRDAFTEARDSLAAALNKARRRRQEDLESIERGLANAARAEEYQQSGDLLQANQHALVRGERAVAVPDYYGGADSTRTIAVDPALTWRENSERYYKKAAKARASRASLEERRLTALEELRLLERSELDVTSVTTEEQVENIHERVAGLLARGTQKPGAPPGSPGQEPPRFDGHKIKTFQSVDGWEILVGENATSNDYLTTKVAASSDIWFHVRAATSAHGIIRAQNRPASVSTAAVRHAAEIVAARSEVKHSSLIPVDYTLKKYVRKPRKSAPGAVTYQNEKTIYVNGIHAVKES